MIAATTHVNPLPTPIAAGQYGRRHAKVDEARMIKPEPLPETQAAASRCVRSEIGATVGASFEIHRFLD